MCQQSSSCPPLPGSLCSGSAFSVTFQSANAVLASRALRRDLLTGESHLPHDFSCLFSPLATCQSPLLLSLLFATHPKKRPISPFLATLPKTPSRKSFVCHTSKTPRGLCARPATSSQAAGEGSACLSSFVFRISHLVFRISSFSLFLSLGASNVQTKVLSFPRRPR